VAQASSDTGPSPPLRVRRAVATIGLTQTIGYAGSFYLPAPLTAAMAPDVGVPPAFVFLVFSGALLVTAFAGPAVGRLIDRHGGRAPLAAASVLLAAGGAGLGLAHDALQLTLAWLVMGVGMCLGLYDAAFAGLVGWYGQDARRAITGVTLMAGFASTVGWPLTAWLESEFGWRGACFAWAGANLLVCLPLHLSLPRGRTVLGGGHRQADDEEPGPDRPRLALALLAAAFALIAGISSAVSAHLPALLTALGVGSAAALGAAALLGPAQVGARLAEFALVRRIHPLVSARVAIGLLPISAAVLLLVGPPAAAAFAILYGAGNGLYTIVRGTLPLALFGVQGFGARAGMINLPGRLLGAASPFLLALGLAASPRLALLGIGAAGLAAFSILLMLRRPRRG
jgi:predicted MFS family arabinose efflux permease